MEQGEYLLRVQLSRTWEGLQLRWRTDLVFNMISASLKETLRRKKKKRRDSLLGASTATQ